MAKPATAVDPQVDFTPESLSTAFQKYRTELIVMPMFTMQPALAHMAIRTGIRYQEHVHEMKGNFEIGPYDKYKMGQGLVEITQRTLQTYFGNCIEPIDVNAIYQSLWGSDINKGEGLKNTPWTKRVCAYIMAQLGEKLYDAMWTAVRNDAGTTTAELFNGFCKIEDIEIAAGAMSAEEQNFFPLTESITAENAEDVINDFIWGNGTTWAGVHKKLRDGHSLKLFMSDRTKHLYEVAYQMNHGSLPYNQQFQKAHPEGKANIEFVALGNVPDNYLSLTSKNNILSLWNQKTADEKFLVEKSLTSHYDNDFIANLFYGEQYLSVNKEMLAVCKADPTAASSGSSESGSGSSEGSANAGTEGAGSESTGTEGAGSESTGTEGTGSESTGTEGENNGQG
ncbi:MAG: hypothetical protein K5683_02860 [Prevotella sp.]|nr:hypothetical protein [Prevotella sp.]